MANTAKQLPSHRAEFSIGSRGISVVEALVALALFSIVITAIMVAAFQAQNLVLNGQTRLEARVLAESSLEDTENSLRNDWFAPLPNTQSIGTYQISVKAADMDDYTKNLSATVSWQLGNKNEDLTINTLISDWKNAKDAIICGAISGNWANPQIIASVDLGPNNSATSAMAKSNQLYVTTDSATQSKPDLFIIDISKPESPEVLSSLNTGPGASSVVVAGNYAFLGNTSINGQLEIIDIRNPHSPVLVKTYKLPGNYNDNTTITNTLIYDRQKIYLGTAKSQVGEFHVIDVSDPLSPRELGNFEINAGINALAARNNTVFVASPANEELKVLDTSDPSAVHQIGGYDAPGGSGNGKSLFRLIHTLYMGRTVGGSELNVLDATAPGSLHLLGSKALGTSINGMTAAETTAFLITNDAPRKLQIWDTKQPENMKIIGSLDLNGTLSGISCQHNTLYITTSSPDGILIIKPEI